jgi:hypothetical protein
MYPLSPVLAIDSHITDIERLYLSIVDDPRRDLGTALPAGWHAIIAADE